MPSLAHINFSVEIYNRNSTHFWSKKQMTCASTKNPTEPYREPALVLSRIKVMSNFSVLYKGADHVYSGRIYTSRSCSKNKKQHTRAICIFSFVSKRRYQFLRFHSWWNTDYAALLRWLLSYALALWWRGGGALCPMYSADFFCYRGGQAAAFTPSEHSTSKTLHINQIFKLSNIKYPELTGSKIKNHALIHMIVQKRERKWDC